MNKEGAAMRFDKLGAQDKDLIMFTITGCFMSTKKVQKTIEWQGFDFALINRPQTSEVQGSGAHGDRVEEEDPDRDVDHLLAHPAPLDHHLCHHFLQISLL